MTTAKIIIILSIVVVVGGLITLASMQSKKNQKKSFDEVNPEISTNKVAEQTFTYQEIVNSITT